MSSYIIHNTYHKTSITYHVISYHIISYNICVSSFPPSPLLCNPHKALWGELLHHGVLSSNFSTENIPSVQYLLSKAKALRTALSTTGGVHRQQRAQPTHSKWNHPLFNAASSSSSSSSSSATTTAQVRVGIGRLSEASRRIVTFREGNYWAELAAEGNVAAIEAHQVEQALLDAVLRRESTQQQQQQQQQQQPKTKAKTKTKSIFSAHLLGLVTLLLVPTIIASTVYKLTALVVSRVCASFPTATAELSSATMRGGDNFRSELPLGSGPSPHCDVYDEEPHMVA